LDAHRGGKIAVTSRVPLRDVGDLEVIYTPGVARVVSLIHDDPHVAWELTGMGSTVGIYTNGSRVLSLGNVGPLASLPVMEGKAVLYRELGGVSAVPIIVDADDPSEFVRIVERTSTGFGAIHLEDIRSPDCFTIEAELAMRVPKPVLHDDQHGTATAVLAALINAARWTKTSLEASTVGQIGLGAAGTGIAQLLIAYGVSSLLVTDPLSEATRRLVQRGAQAVDLPTLMASARFVVAATGKPGLITPEMVRPGQVVLALSNPDPEIAPAAALAAGAAMAAEGSAINNALAFPGLFRGALDARSRSIAPPMLIAAARVIAAHADEGTLVPPVLGTGLHRAVAAAVRDQARRLGLAETARP
jgi:malate dehydrogenase (oxaloacetate-decarboxylating)